MSILETTEMKFSNYALNMIATNLSDFTEPNIPALALKEDKTLEINMMECVRGVFSGSENQPVRYLMTNIARRIFGSIEGYRQGRAFAFDYLQRDRHSIISPYFSALTSFETCISYSWQVPDIFREISKLAPVSTLDLFERGDGSSWERLHNIYTKGTKHSYDQYDQEQSPEMPTTVWLTNEGISCVSGVSISYAELIEAITINNTTFYKLREKAREFAEAQ